MDVDSSSSSLLWTVSRPSRTVQTDTDLTNWSEAAHSDFASPISTENRWFECVDVYKAKLVLHATKNIIFAVTTFHSRGCSDLEACWNDLECSLDDDSNAQISSAEFKPFHLIGNRT